MSSPFAAKVREVLGWPLPLIVLFALLLRVAAADATRTQDDLRYITYAAKIAQGAPEKPEDDYKAYRLGFLLPLAGLFALFGVCTGVANALVVGCGTGCVAVAYAIGLKLAGPFAGSAAALLTAVTTQHVLASGEIFVDAPLCLLEACAMWCYLAARGGQAQTRLLLLSGIFLGLGYTFNVGALSLAVLLGAFELLWAIRKRDFRGLAIFAGIAGIIVLEVVLSVLLFGEAYPRHREFSFLQGWSAQLAVSPDEDYKSLTNYFKSFVSPFGPFGILFPVGVAGVVIAVRRSGLGALIGWFSFLVAQVLYGCIAHGFRDGKYLATLAVPTALLAALVFEVIYRRRPHAAVFGLVTVGLLSVVLVHTRISASTFSVKKRLDAIWASDPRPLYVDQRTLRYVQTPLSRRVDRASVHDFTFLTEIPPNSLVLLDWSELEAVRAIAGHKPPPFATHPPGHWRRIHVERYEARGWPGFRQAADALVSLKHRILRRPTPREAIAELYEVAQPAR